VPSNAVGTGLGNYTISYMNGTLNRISGGANRQLGQPQPGSAGADAQRDHLGNNLTGATAVSFGADITVNSFTVNSATQITASITISVSATAGLRDVSVTTPAARHPDQRLHGPDHARHQFSQPTQAVQGQALSVTITGTNLSGVTAVGFGSGITVNSFIVDSSTQITASIAVSDSATVGARDVSVTKAGGTATLTGGFTVNQAAPDIVSVVPIKGPGQAENVTITGTHLTGATSVDFGAGVTVNSFSVTPSGSSQVQIGTGTTAVSLPFYTNYDDARIQSILLASEIGQPGVIQKLRLYCSIRPGQNLSNSTSACNIPLCPRSPPEATSTADGLRSCTRPT